MKKIILFILLLIFSKGTAQTEVSKKLANSKTLELSKTYQNKALWYLDMPQYNQDSFKKHVQYCKATLPFIMKN